ncbi:hypothetical protein [Corynebacterium glutamicum]|uniref:hypothetical protein n=1 Tax=Corynebacterium glutamicum TaxID=1718 RepID=UPI000744AF94|nr:hypothetical protein [Corynebacterium glutamicum]AMA00148.1 hypothetical protein APT58_07885 [Corynebacterium glutamicum]
MGHLIIDPAGPSHTDHELLHNYLKGMIGYECIDAYNIVDLPTQTPFDWSMCGYYAVFTRMKVSAYIYLAAIRDGKIHICEMHETQCPSDYLDADQKVMSTLQDTSNEQALRWRTLVREKQEQVAPAEKQAA